MAETVEQVARQKEVREALEQTTGKPQPVKAEAKDKFWFVTHALLLAGCAVLAYVVGLKLVPLPTAYLEPTQRAIRGAAMIIIVLAIAKAVSVYAIGRVSDAATRFTLRRD